MGTLTYSHTLVAGTNENVNDVQDMFNDARTVINGTLDSTNFSTATNQFLGLTDASVRRGKTVIATEETRNSASYGLLGTADRVTNIVLPTDGLIAVMYKAELKGSVATAGRAAIFLGATQLKVPAGGAAADQAAVTSNTADLYGIVSSLPIGLSCLAGGAGAWPGDATTGQAVAVTSGAGGITRHEVGGTAVAVSGTGVDPGMGGVCYIHAAAGTYDVSVQFKATSGTVTAKNRKLWVWTMAF